MAGGEGIAVDRGDTEEDGSSVGGRSGSLDDQFHRSDCHNIRHQQNKHVVGMSEVAGVRGGEVEQEEEATDEEPENAMT